MRLRMPVGCVPVVFVSVLEFFLCRVWISKSENVNLIRMLPIGLLIRRRHQCIFLFSILLRTLIVRIFHAKCHLSHCSDETESMVCHTVIKTARISWMRKTTQVLFSKTMLRVLQMLESKKTRYTYSVQIQRSVSHKITLNVKIIVSVLNRCSLHPYSIFIHTKSTILTTV